ncbi:hypothetical protein GCM10022226_04080 [Sphaerisporangium flaviroseum]|uniref:Uncharacterized protein n=1 Tax=Sphaerisporangium flaviroseum TaxID=509199 RepID=A0ABP7H912_9ACTN
MRACHAARGAARRPVRGWPGPTWLRNPPAWSRRQDRWPCPYAARALRPCAGRRDPWGPEWIQDPAGWSRESSLSRGRAFRSREFRDRAFRRGYLRGRASQSREWPQDRAFPSREWFREWFRAYRKGRERLRGGERHRGRAVSRDQDRRDRAAGCRRGRAAERSTGRRASREPEPPRAASARAWWDPLPDCRE